LAANGVYTLVITVGTCTNSTTSVVNINPLPTPTAISNSPVCLLQPIVFTGSGGTTYTWTGPGLNTTVQNPTISVAQSSNTGVYTLSVTNTNGCVNFTTTNVVVNPLPSILTNSPTVCAGQNINLTATGGTAYVWSGPNGFGSTLQNPTIANAQPTMSGVYTVTVTSAQGCTNTAVSQVSVITLPVPAITHNTPCVGATLTFTGSGGTGYSWTGPNGFSSPFQNPSISNVQLTANGIYTLVITVGTCTNSTTSVVNINPLPTPTAISNSPVCLLQPIVFTGSGGTTYTWTGPGLNTTVQNPTIAVAQSSNTGVYTLSVTNGNGCVNFTTTNVVVNPLPTIVTNSPIVCTGQTMNFSATGGTAYAWSGPGGFSSTLQNPSIVNAQPTMSGIYTVMVTSAQGCTATAVSQASVITLPSPAITNNTPCVGATLTFTGSGGASYSWSGPNGFNSTSQNPTIPNVQLTAGGVYTLVVTVGSCTNSTTGNVTINSLPTPTATSNSPVCLFQPINFTGLGGVTYTWSGPGLNSNSQNPIIGVAQNTNAGVYTLSVSNANGCVNYTTTVVSINPLPTIITNSPVVCTNQNINLSASGGTAYAWSGQGGGFTSTLQNPTIVNAQPSMSGLYTVQVTSSQGCTNTALANVSVVALPNANANNNGAVCVGATIGFTASGGSSYSWSGPNGFSSSFQNPSIGNVQLTAMGMYSVVVTGAGSCTSMATTSVTINALPTPTATSNSPVCLNKQINLSAGTGTAYAWVGPGGFLSQAQTPVINSASMTNAGTYTVSVTDANGCSNFTTTSVVVNPLPTLIANNPLVCAGNNINLTSGGAVTYSWTGPNAFTSNLQNPALTNATPGMSGAYTVSGTSALSCTNSAVASVTVVPNPTGSIGSNTPCAGQSLSLTSSGTGQNFNWSGPNGFSSTLQNPIINGIGLSGAGTYSLIVSAGTCTGSTSAVIMVNPVPTISLTNNSPVCERNTITLNASGGTGYSWSGPANYNTTTSGVSIANAAISNAGTYTVVVTDGNGCQNTAVTPVVVNALPVIAVVGSTVCEKTTVNLSASGGTAYTWTGPNSFTASGSSQQLPNASPSMIGTYTVNVTDGNGCSSASLTEVYVNTIPTVTMNANTPVCVNQSIQFQASSPTGINYVWTGPNGYYSTQKNPRLDSATAQASGIYTVLVMDNIGCSVRGTFTMVVNSLPLVSVASDKTRGCVPFCIYLNPGSSVQLKSVLWQFGDGNSESGLGINKCYTSAGNYTINSIFTDINNCSNTAKFYVEAWPKPEADFNFSPTKPIINENIEFSDDSRGANIASWTWNFSNLPGQKIFDTHYTTSYENAGTYVAALLVVSDKGCKDTAIKTITVGEDFGIYVPDAFSPNGDGLNDVFQPKGFGIVKYELNIFDRWGEKVFTTADFNTAWDGTFPKRSGDDIIKQDVYIWEIKLTNSFGKSTELSGKVTIIK
jgi:gliding motility-associated-like protein